MCRKVRHEPSAAAFQPLAQKQGKDHKSLVFLESPVSCDFTRFIDMTTVACLRRVRSLAPRPQYQK